MPETQEMESGRATGVAASAAMSDSDVGSPAVIIEHLSHRYPKSRRRSRSRNRRSSQPQPSATTEQRPALDDVTFDVHVGELFGILGPNGGGKTTLFRILSTMLQPTSTSAQHASACAPTPLLGESNGGASEGAGIPRVEIFTHDVVADPGAARRQLGVVFQHPSLDLKLTARENLIHHGRLYGLDSATLNSRIDHWLGRFDLTDRQHDYVGTFSGGMRRKLEIAKALLHQPRLLLMDEPTTGLDPAARREVWDRLRDLRGNLGVTIMLTTHLMDEAERCDRLAILSRGRLAAADTPAALKAQIGGDIITIEPNPAAQDNSPEQLAAIIAERLGPWPDDAAPKVADGSVRIEHQQGVNLIETLRETWPDRIRSITVGQPTLEDVFFHLTGSAFWQ